MRREQSLLAFLILVTPLGMQNSEVLNKTSYVLGSELWEQNLLSLVREFVVNQWEVRKQNYMPMTHALINFSLSLHLRVWGVLLGLRGKGMVGSGKVSCTVFVMHVVVLLMHVMCVLMHAHVLVGVNVIVVMCILVWIRVHVCVDPPIVVGVWPMTGTVWQLFE